VGHDNQLKKNSKSIFIGRFCFLVSKLIDQSLSAGQIVKSPALVPHDFSYGKIHPRFETNQWKYPKD